MLDQIHLPVGFLRTTLDINRQYLLPKASQANISAYLSANLLRSELVEVEIVWDRNMATKTRIIAWHQGWLINNAI